MNSFYLFLIFVGMITACSVIASLLRSSRGNKPQTHTHTLSRIKLVSRDAFTEELDPEKHNALLAENLGVHKILKVSDGDEEILILFSKEKKHLLRCSTGKKVEFGKLKYLPEMRAFAVGKTYSERYFDLWLPDGSKVDDCQEEFKHVQDGVFSIVRTAHGSYDSWWMEVLFYDTTNGRYCSLIGQSWRFLKQENLLVVGELNLFNLSTFWSLRAEQTIREVESDASSERITLRHGIGQKSYVMNGKLIVFGKEYKTSFSDDWVILVGRNDYERIHFFFNLKTGERSKNFLINCFEDLGEGIFLFGQNAGWTFFNFHSKKSSGFLDHRPFFKTHRVMENSAIRFDSGEGTHFDLDPETMKCSTYMVTS